MSINTDTIHEPQLQPTTPDIFADLAAIRLNPSMTGGPSVAKVLASVPVRKPSKEWFIRAHPDREKQSVDSLFLELKEDGETYLIAPRIRESLQGESCVQFKKLSLAVNRQGDIFLWPIRLPDTDGKLDAWNQSALDALSIATTKWVRISSNRRIGAYEIASADISEEPKWPDMPFNELLRFAFKGKVIDAHSHPVLRRLRGDV